MLLRGVGDPLRDPQAILHNQTQKIKIIVKVVVTVKFELKLEFGENA